MSDISTAEALLGAPITDDNRDELSSTLGRFGWLEAMATSLRDLCTENADFRATWLGDDPDASFECEREVDDLIKAVRPLLLKALTTRLAPDRTERAREIVNPLFDKRVPSGHKWVRDFAEECVLAALTPATAPDREAIARIIDPWAWDDDGSHTKNMGQEITLAKADDILSYLKLIKGEG